MIPDIKIHNRNHLIKSILGNIEYIVSGIGYKANELLVINYHGTPKKFEKNFISQIKFFKDKFTIISPAQLTLFYDGLLEPSNKPLLLITFDDGIKNNLRALEILCKEGIKAYSFIVPDFVETPAQLQKGYFTNYIRPQVNYSIDGAEEDTLAMSWNDIKNLITKGHSIGSHTKTHTLVSAVSTNENSRKEIEKSKTIIAEKIGTDPASISSFCSINNTLESISIKEARLVQNNYKYHFTTIPGPNHPNGNPYYIKRVNIESFWLAGSVKYAIGKWNLDRWRAADRSYSDILNSL